MRYSVVAVRTTYCWHTNTVDFLFPSILVPQSTDCKEMMVAATGFCAAMRRKEQSNMTPSRRIEASSFPLCLTNLTLEECDANLSLRFHQKGRDDEFSLREFLGRANAYANFR